MIAFVVFIAIWRLESQRVWVITPFLIFGGVEAFVTWPAAIEAAVVDGYWLPLWIALTAFSAFLVGVLFAFSAMRFRPTTAWEFRSRPLLDANDPRHKFAVAGTAAVLLVAGLYFYGGMPPLVQGFRMMFAGISLQDASLYVHDARYLVSKEHYFGGAYRGQGLIRQLLRVGWPMLTAIALMIYVERRTRTWLFATMALGLAAFAFVAGDGTRGRVIWGLVYVLVVLSLHRRVPVRALVLGGVGVFLLFAVTSGMSAKLQVDENYLFGTVPTALGERILFPNGRDNVDIIRFIGEGSLHHRDGGVHAQAMLNALPGVQVGVPFTHELYLLQSGGGPLTTYSSPTYLGILYADFRWGGVIVAYWALGGLMVWIQARLFRIRRTIVGLTMAGLVALYAGRVAITGPQGLLAMLAAGTAVYAVLRGCYWIAGTGKPRGHAPWPDSSRGGRDGEPSARSAS